MVKTVISKVFDLDFQYCLLAYGQKRLGYYFGEGLETGSKPAG
jgi:hypothetical protein